MSSNSLWPSETEWLGMQANIELARVSNLATIRAATATAERVRTDWQRRDAIEKELSIRPAHTGRDSQHAPYGHGRGAD
jgi:hypothetical protein